MLMSFICFTVYDLHGIPKQIELSIRGELIKEHRPSSGQCPVCEFDRGQCDSVHWPGHLLVSTTSNRSAAVIAMRQQDGHQDARERELF